MRIFDARTPARQPGPRPDQGPDRQVGIDASSTWSRRARGSGLRGATSRSRIRFDVDEEGRPGGGSKKPRPTATAPLDTSWSPTWAPAQKVCHRRGEIRRAISLRQLPAREIMRILGRFWPGQAQNSSCAGGENGSTRLEGLGELELGDAGPIDSPTGHSGTDSCKLHTSSMGLKPASRTGSWRWTSPIPDPADPRQMSGSPTAQPHTRRHRLRPSIKWQRAIPAYIPAHRRLQAQVRYGQTPEGASAASGSRSRSSAGYAL